ncbi:hypothetical protein PVAND_008282 [Polypedilum vanderplanki]|uniref:Uncharacterized protein n=1 Tax=Polypedilum vanderplanki TaxID=319348 RepID=A0A9J6C9A2_POLVA|nr:hypothetical protein PVAND_008282 [Polypedilum vanderplanki]
MEYFPDSESLMSMKNLDYQILSTFYMKNKRLEEAHRKDLARVIITSIFEKNPETRLTTDQFIHLSHVIVSVFETEVKETYYIPSKKSSSPKGKLYSQYNNYREKMYDVGLITRNAREKTKTNEPQFNEMIKIEKS